MNVDKWTQCSHFLLINGPIAVIVLYWASNGSCYCIFYRLGLDRAPHTKETMFDFVKLWIPVIGTQRCGINDVVSSYTISTG